VRRKLVGCCSYCLEAATRGNDGGGIADSPVGRERSSATSPPSQIPMPTSARAPPRLPREGWIRMAFVSAASGASSEASSGDRRKPRETLERGLAPAVHFASDRPPPAKGDDGPRLSSNPRRANCRFLPSDDSINSKL
jgi:hypothetical protein